MSEPDNDLEAISEIARFKALAPKQNARAKWVGLVPLVAAIAVGVWSWMYRPMGAGEEYAGVCCVLGFVACFVAIVVCKVVGADSPWVTPKCPKCGFLWDSAADESSEGHDWQTWKHCPGCGLKMSD